MASHISTPAYTRHTCNMQAKQETPQAADTAQSSRLRIAFEDNTSMMFDSNDTAVTSLRCDAMLTDESADTSGVPQHSLAFDASKQETLLPSQPAAVSVCDQAYISSHGELVTPAAVCSSACVQQLPVPGSLHELNHQPNAQHAAAMTVGFGHHDAPAPSIQTIPSSSQIFFPPGATSVSESAQQLSVSGRRHQPSESSVRKQASSIFADSSTESVACVMTAEQSASDHCYSDDSQHGALLQIMPNDRSPAATQTVSWLHLMPCWHRLASCNNHV